MLLDGAHEPIDVNAKPPVALLIEKKKRN